MNKVTIICPCYNQESFIRQTLEGFVRQETKFDFIALIGDDASTDGTPGIVKKYAEKYPKRIKAILRDKNLGAAGNALDLYCRCSSPYLAICEGDDYWTDNKKLQKQADFLDNNPEYAICFHPVAILYENNGMESGIFPSPKTRFNKLSLDLTDIKKRNFIQTNSVMYRWRFKENDPELDRFVSCDIQPGDYVMHLLHAQTGKIGCIDEVMAVYRKHDKGIWFHAGITDRWFLKNGLSVIGFEKFKEQQFGINSAQSTIATTQRIVAAALKAKDFYTLEELSIRYPQAYDACILKNFRSKSNLLRLFKYKLFSKLFWGEKRKKYMLKHQVLKSAAG